MVSQLKTHEYPVAHKTYDYGFPFVFLINASCVPHTDALHIPSGFNLRPKL